jgi:hypothetical protein
MICVPAEKWKRQENHGRASEYREKAARVAGRYHAGPKREYEAGSRKGKPYGKDRWPPAKSLLCAIVVFAPRHRPNEKKISYAFRQQD